MNEMLTGQDALIARLEDENARLRRELAAKDEEIKNVENQNAVAVKNLRRALNPLYTALRQVFGEIDVIVGPADVRPSAPSGRWDEWKIRLGPSCAKVIDALQLGGEMTVTAIMTTAKMGKQTVYQATSKMGQAGIIVRNGSKFSLKQQS